MRPLHKLSPVRLGFVKEQLCAHFVTADGGKRDVKDPRALDGLTVLDIGCGGGLVSEPLTRMGATVTGIDPADETIAAAKLHANAAGLAIDYRATTAEALAEQGLQFDAVLALEVVEHVTSVPAFVATCAELIRPGGLFIASTINRTMKAWALAIVGAEYVLRWLPRGTHSYDKLVTPDELSAALRAAGLTRRADTGAIYDPIVGAWRLSTDTDVNYMMVAGKPMAHQGSS